MMLYFKLGTVMINEICAAAIAVFEKGEDTGYMFAAGICILFGFGAKAGMFPLHIWLPKAHPVAPAPASALLSGILTKSGIYGVLILCFEIFRYNEHWGIIILVLGVITMFVGAVLAVFSVDLKRTLACSSMSQIGFILTGCAVSVLLKEESSLSGAGTVLYMINHSLFKLVLFMCAGAVYMKLHKLDLNDIRGFGRKNNFLKIIFAIGALGIMGVPLFSGYISKTLIHEGIVEYAHELTGAAHTAIKAVEYLFLLSGGMTIGYMLKLFIAVFVEKPNSYSAGRSSKNNGHVETHEHHVDFEKKWSVSPLSKIALVIPAAVIVVCGVVTPIYIDHLSVYMSDITHSPEIEHLEIFSLENLKGFAISLTIGLLVYLFIRKCLMKEVDGRKVYVDRWPKILDLEELVYRPVLLKALPGLFGSLFKGMIALTKFIWGWMLKIGTLFKGMIALTKFFWEWTVKIGKGIGYAASFFGEAVIYSIKKIFFKDLVENRHSPMMERLYAKFDAGDRTLRMIESTISYSILWLLLGLIGTIIFLILH